MPKSKHTPNEWYAHRDVYGDGYCYRIEIRGNPIKSYSGSVIGSESICVLHSGFVHFEGNAELILAAPKLLETLEGLMKWCDPWAVPGSEENQKSYLKAKELLEKLRG